MSQVGLLRSCNFSKEQIELALKLVIYPVLRLFLWYLRSFFPNISHKTKLHANNIERHYSDVTGFGVDTVVTSCEYNGRTNMVDFLYFDEN